MIEIRQIEQFRRFARRARERHDPIVTVLFRPETLEALADVLVEAEYNHATSLEVLRAIPEIPA